MPIIKHKTKENVLNLYDAVLSWWIRKNLLNFPDYIFSLISVKQCYEILIKEIEEIEKGNVSIKLLLDDKKTLILKRFE